MEKKQKSVDSFCRNDRISRHIDWPLAQFMKKYGKNSSVLISPSGYVKNFSTETLELHHVKNFSETKYASLDGFFRTGRRMPVSYAARHRSEIKEYIGREYGNLVSYVKNTFVGRFDEMSMVKVWNVSIVAALFLGMFIMTSIYRYLGQSAAAKLASAPPHAVIEFNRGNQGEVLGEAIDPAKKKGDNVEKVIAEYQRKKDNSQQFEKISGMVKGYPIEKLAPFISEQDKTVAAFLISIAKKESNWGKRVPVLDGQDCFNYWGYRGIRKRMGTDGHTCFDSPQDAVKTVAKRLKYLVEEEDMDTPKKMVVVWKCGYDCSWDSPAAVNKWVSDVEQYFDKLR